jgi:hypothetical protein
MRVDLWARLDGRIIYSQCDLLSTTGGNRKCARHITCVLSLLEASVMLMGISLLWPDYKEDIAFMFGILLQENKRFDRFQAA